jgi:hypothetical protein
VRLPTAVRLSCVVLAACFVSLAWACAGPGAFVSGSGTPATKDYDYTGFARLDVSNAFSVDVTRGQAFRVSVTVDDNLTQFLEVRLDGNTLRVALQSGNSYTGTHLKATLTLPELTYVNLSGAADVRLHGFDSDRPLELRLSGASTLDLGTLRAGDATLQLSGAARVTGTATVAAGDFQLSGGSRASLRGSAGSVSFDASGGSNLDLAGLTVGTLKAQMSGGSDASVKVTGRLDAELSGGARLEYSGSPTMGNIHTSGGAEVRPAGQ